MATQTISPKGNQNINSPPVPARAAPGHGGDNDAPGEAEYLQINSCGSFTNAERARPPWEENMDYCLIYQRAGTGWVRQNDKTHMTKSGDIFIYCPEEKRTYQCDEYEHTAVFWVCFSGYGARQLLQRLNLVTGSPCFLGFSPEIDDLKDKIVAEFESTRHGSAICACALFQQLLAIISRCLAEMLPNNLSIRNMNIYKSLEYIRMNFASYLSVHALAAMACQSHNYYTTAFYELIGVTPRRYIIMLRLQKAMELMETTDWDVGQVAAAVGYKDQMYFSRIFKQHIRMSPTDYIKLVNMRGAEREG